MYIYIYNIYIYMYIYMYIYLCIFIETWWIYFEETSCIIESQWASFVETPRWSPVRELIAIIDPPKTTYVVFDFLWSTDCKLDTLFGGVHIAFIRFLCSFPILQSIDVKQTGWISMGSGAKMSINTETPEVPGSKIGMRVVSCLGPKMFDASDQVMKKCKGGRSRYTCYLYIQIHIQL